MGDGANSSIPLPLRSRTTTKRAGLRFLEADLRIARGRQARFWTRLCRGGRISRRHRRLARRRSAAGGLQAGAASNRL